MRRRILIIALLFLQLLFFNYTVWDTTRRYDIVELCLSLLSFCVALYVVSSKDKQGYKVTWVMIILSLPIFGGLFYLMFKVQSSAHNLRKLSKPIDQKASRYLTQPKAAITAFEALSPEHINQAEYLIRTVGYPLYANTTVEYLSPGEKQFERMLHEIRRAKRYVFLEYFIIGDGDMWRELLSLLEEKVDAGVDVRIIYDDVGCFLRLPSDFDKNLEKRGIKVAVFNPFHPIWSTVQNNRDHRKITVIDGRVAFTGGSNIADEYINKVSRFGYWKDAGIMLEGDAAWSFTVMFLRMWENLRRTDEDYDRFRPDPISDLGAKGFVQPYDDSPLDTENVGEHVYMQLINRARRYLYIATPYLIVDDSMLSALRLAAKSGVDVRITTPHIPDKKLVFMTTRSYYAPLIEAGVRIYEYTPGFLHSKVFISDDMTATVGTANLDFRSLYLHFECGACLYDTPEILAIKNDYLSTLSDCMEITADSRICRGNFAIRTARYFLRLLAPLF